MNGIVCGQQWYVDWIFSYQIPKIDAYVDYVAYLRKLGFEFNLGSDTRQ